MQATQETQVASSPGWLTLWKDGSAATASTLTAISLIAAAIGSYILFIRDRQRFPRANVTHRLFDWPAGDMRMVRGVVRVENVGTVMIEVGNIRGVLTQILPLPDDVASAVASGVDPVDKESTEVLWDTLGDRFKDFRKDACEIEPNEPEEFFFDFVIPLNVTKIQFYTHVQNARKWKRNVGWNTTTVYDIGDGRDKHVAKGVGSSEALKAKPAAEEGIGRDGEAPRRAKDRQADR